LSRTPSAASRRTSGAALSPRVFVTGIFANTFAPHAAICRAWRSISSKSSEKTSNEIGRSATLRSTSRANVS
jgi:hypothetical protein